MSFGEAVKTCFRKYVTFSGRARRPEYWWFALFVFLAVFVLSLIDSLIFGASTPEAPRPQPLSSIFQLAVLVPMLAAGWRRMHDTGRPGWYLLLPLVVSIAVSVFLLAGAAGLALIERDAADSDGLREAAGFAGLGGLALGAILQFAMIALLVWWLSRPGDVGENRFGPPPA